MAAVSDGRLARKLLDGKMITHLDGSESLNRRPKSHDFSFPSTFDTQILVLHHRITSQTQSEVIEASVFPESRPFRWLCRPERRSLRP